MKIVKVNKYLNVSYERWFKPVFHCFNSFFFYFNSLGQENVAPKTNFAFVKMTLFEVSKEFLPF